LGASLWPMGLPAPCMLSLQTEMERKSGTSNLKTSIICD
jgi:hypothetical protein